MDDVQGDIDGDPEEQTEDEIVIIPVKDNRSKTVKGFSNNTNRLQYQHRYKYLVEQWNCRIYLLMSSISNKFTFYFAFQ